MWSLVTFKVQYIRVRTRCTILPWNILTWGITSYAQQLKTSYYNSRKFTQMTMLLTCWQRRSLKKSLSYVPSLLDWIHTKLLNEIFSLCGQRGRLLAFLTTQFGFVNVLSVKMVTLSCIYTSILPFFKSDRGKWAFFYCREKQVFFTYSIRARVHDSTPTFRTSLLPTPAMCCWWLFIYLLQKHILPLV